MAELWTADAAFVPVSNEAREWWTFGMPDDPDEQTGKRCVEILETIDTLNHGRIAIYRRWGVDPDGKEVGSKAKRIANYRSVRRLLRMHRMERADA